MKDRNCSLPRDGGEACFVGVDVSSKRLDVGILPGDEFREFTNDSQGINELVEHLKTRNVELIVTEATGGYEVDVAAGLTAAGLPIVVVNPRHVRDFARSLGFLPRPTRSMHGSWRVLLAMFVPKRERFLRTRSGFCRNCSRVAANSAECEPRS